MRGSYVNLLAWQENITEESFLVARPILHIGETLRSTNMTGPRVQL